MSTFITGATGYLGSYALHTLLQETTEDLQLLVRAKDDNEAREKLWRALQLHMTPEEFWGAQYRLRYVYGDLHADGLGLSKKDHRRILDTTDSVLHIAASLNRKSSKACFNTNLRGTLSVIVLVRALADRGGFRRFSHVSTNAIAGERKDELVLEDEARDFDRSDYDPYARTKKFAEHMVDTLLPDVPHLCLRPGIVLGDSRFPETTQFDMVRAFVALVDLPVLPLSEHGRLDIVNADFVGPAIARLHTKETLAHDIYHLTSGAASETAGQIARKVAKALDRRPPRFVSRLESPVGRLFDMAATRRKRDAIQQVGTLMKVFWPYITFNTIFDNTRVVSELKQAPARFSDYGAPLYRFAKEGKFTYDYKPLPERKPMIPVGIEVHA
ncbi:MAG: SDR family oxidoreductase [Myxococcales bacterium]|nr:SDR family oxidoreductase [Myxococcales bacterium]